MNVCMLMNRFYPIVSGAEKQAQRLSRSLRARGINAFVVTCRYRDLARHETIDTIPVHRIHTMYRDMKPRGMIASLHMAASLFHYLLRNREAIDIIHVHGAGNMAMTANIVKPLINKPVVVKVATASTAHISAGDLHGAETALLGNVRLSLLKKCDAFIATTEQIKRELIDCGVAEERIVLIPNGVDTERFTPSTRDDKRILREKLGIRAGPACLFVGRLIRRKGIDVLLRAWKEVMRDITDATLFIVGGGEEKETLQRLSESLRISTGVSFLGHIGPAEVVEYYKISDLFAFPSRGEGMPNAILEAMSSGLPVIATAIGGIVDMITDGGNGRLVPADDHGALAASIKEVLPRGGDILGREGRRTVLERFSLGTVTDLHAALYERLIAAS